MTCPDCGKEYAIGDWPLPCKGAGHEMQFHDAQIHASQKVVVYENQHNGDIRIPGRTDRPMHPKYEAAGYRRKTIDSIGGVREVERKTGLQSEILNYDANSARADRDSGAI